jgi:FkbM family methyltransferase
MHSLIEFKICGDDRGSLVAIENGAAIPFDIKRIFYVFNSSPDVVRGCHANRKSQFVLIALHGSCNVTIRDKSGNVTVTLDRPNVGLWLSPMVWKEMHDFSEGAVLMVLSDNKYDKDEYISDFDQILGIDLDSQYRSRHPATDANFSGTVDRADLLMTLDQKLDANLEQLNQLGSVAQSQLEVLAQSMYWRPGNQLVQIDTCEKLLSEESFNQFTGDIKEEYLRLVSGLDSESVATVVRVLSRIQRYRSENTSYFWFTDLERRELLNIYDQHYSRILKLPGNSCAYGTYLLPSRIISTTVFYYKHFLNKLNRLDKLKSKNIIDVGGFIGDSALIFSPYTNKNVHVFEPVTHLYELLEETIRLNNLTNIVPQRLALGESSHTSEIYIRGDTSTLCRSEQTTCRAKEEVQVIALDDYVEQNDLKVGLIKVDIEGYEQAFLRGAEHTIKSQRPTLLLSIYHSSKDFFEIKPLIESWNLGYRFQIAKPSDLTIIVDTTLIAEVDEGGDD